MGRSAFDKDSLSTFVGIRVHSRVHFREHFSKSVYAKSHVVGLFLKRKGCFPRDVQERKRPIKAFFSGQFRADSRWKRLIEDKCPGKAKDELLAWATRQTGKQPPSIKVYDRRLTFAVRVLRALQCFLGNIAVL